MSAEPKRYRMGMDWSLVVDPAGSIVRVEDYDKLLAAFDALEARHARVREAAQDLVTWCDAGGDVRMSELFRKVAALRAALEDK